MWSDLERLRNLEFTYGILVQDVLHIAVDFIRIARFALYYRILGYLNLYEEVSEEQTLTLAMTNLLNDDYRKLEIRNLMTKMDI